MKVEGNSLNRAQVKLTPLKENVEDIMFGSGDPDFGHSDFNAYRRSGGSRTGTDLDPLTHERMQQIALILNKTNPMAHRILHMSASFAIGGSLSFEAENNKVQKILQDHWEHPVNQWERQLYQYIFELGLYGELFLRAHVNETDGGVTIGYISPLRVKGVERDPETGVLTNVIIRGNGSNVQDQPLEIINYVTDPRDPDKGFYKGEVFFWRVNEVSDSTRGISDLLPLSDYLDGLDQFLFDLLERSSHQNMWMWDVLLEGATESDIDKWLTSFHSKPPKPGSIRAHNERVTWTPLAPALGGTDNSEHVRLFKSYILGGAGFAEWMFGEGGKTGRSQASEMLEPTLRALKQRQKEAKYIVSDVFNFLIDQKIQKNELKTKRLDRRFYVSMPTINLKDVTKSSQALWKGAQALQILNQNNLISPERAARITNELLNELDLEGDYDRAHKEVESNFVARSDNPNDPAAAAGKSPTAPVAPPPGAKTPASDGEGGGKPAAKVTLTVHTPTSGKNAKAKRPK